MPPLPGRSPGSPGETSIGRGETSRGGPETPRDSVGSSPADALRSPPPTPLAAPAAPAALGGDLLLAGTVGDHARSDDDSSAATRRVRLVRGEGRGVST